MIDDLLIWIRSKCAALRGSELTLTSMKLHIRGTLNQTLLVRRINSLLTNHNYRCLLAAARKHVRCSWTRMHQCVCINPVNQPS